MPTPQEVFTAISSERTYQQQRWPVGTGCNRSIGEEILCAQLCLQDAASLWQSGDDNNQHEKLLMLHAIRKTAAVLVRCLESHGAPLRAGIKPDPYIEQA